jgi:hypothetical protein
LNHRLNNLSAGQKSTLNFLGPEQISQIKKKSVVISPFQSLTVAGRNLRYRMIAPTTAKSVLAAALV